MGRRAPSDRRGSAPRGRCGSGCSIRSPEVLTGRGIRDRAISPHGCLRQHARRMIALATGCPRRTAGWIEPSRPATQGRFDMRVWPERRSTSTSSE
jgi:hypothetical protein